MWIPKAYDQDITIFLLLAINLCLAIICSRLAWYLPQKIDSKIRLKPNANNKYYRIVYVLLVPLLSLLCVQRMGLNQAAIFASAFILLSLLLAWIDAITGLLPDVLTLGLLWLGLLANLFNLFAGLDAAVLGAMAGYLLMRLVYHVFLLFTGKPALGFGDFKFFAAIGAWFGWQALPRVLLFAAGLALIVVIFRRVFGSLKPGESFSFGPFLAVSGITVMLGF